MTHANFDGQWFHFIETVYGAWLYGDKRGFRTRHHREHVEGDYKNPPPPGTYDAVLERSRKLLKQPPVSLEPKWRAIVGQAVVERLGDRGAYVLCASMSRQHLHCLAKLPPSADARHIMGLAKKHSHFIANDHGWSGKLWAKRGKEQPVRDRSHQLNTYHYILRHRDEGAWIYDAMATKPAS
jgi:hypothetical protein